jgi:hypothetical protein
MFRRYIPDSPGLRRPGHMDEEEWQEYRFSEEARVELPHVPDEGYYERDEVDDDRADAEAEDRAERLAQARREAEEIPLDELMAAAEILEREIAKRVDGT